jgi:hypothetical protein
VIGVPAASAVLRQQGNRTELDVVRMAPPPGGRVYQVWLQRPGQVPEPTDTLFTVSPNGRAAVVVPGDLHGVGRVLVTSEPPRGSKVPTRPPVIIATLT